MYAARNCAEEEDVPRTLFIGLMYQQECKQSHHNIENCWKNAQYISGFSFTVYVHVYIRCMNKIIYFAGSLNIEIV